MWPGVENVRMINIERVDLILTRRWTDVERVRVCTTRHAVPQLPYTQMNWYPWVGWSAESSEKA